MKKEAIESLPWWMIGVSGVCLMWWASKLTLACAEPPQPTFPYYYPDCIFSAFFNVPIKRRYKGPGSPLGSLAGTLRRVK